MPIIPVAGSLLNYRLDGPSDAPIIMLGNSLGTTLELWDDQLAAFARHFRVLRYDMRGHGRSSLGVELCSVERLAMDAVALLDTLGLASVHFCGLSLGGMVGMWLAAQAPDRLNRLVLCNTAASLGPEASWDARIAAVQSGGMTAIAAAVLERWFSPGFREREPEVVKRALHMLLNIDPAGYMAACGAARAADQRSNVARVRATTLVIAGQHDQATPPSEGRWLVELIEGARYLELPTAHLSNVESPVSFNAAVLGFLAG
jgi:3-oxoadipate enol-lactonase